MDRLLQHLSQFKTYSQDQLSDLQKKLEALDISLLAIREPQDPLHQIDPSVHSLAFLYILNARLVSNDTTCLIHAARFSDMCEYTQLKQSRSALETFGNNLALFADQHGIPGLVIRILYPLCIRIRKSYISSLKNLKEREATVSDDLPLYVMTPVHSVLLKYMMLTNFYDLELPGLNGCVSISDSISPSTREFLSFEYYSALRYIGIRDYQKAIEHCSACLLIPSSVASAIQVHAFKKLCLLSLLVTGKQYKPPKYVSLPLQRACRVVSEPYLKLTTIFEGLNSQKLQEFIEAHKSEFEADGNGGLVNNLGDALSRRLIRNLTKTYQTLSLIDMTRMVGLPADNIGRVESMLVDMIHQGHISASISHAQNGMVTFLNSDKRFDDMSSLNEIAQEYEALSSVISRIESLNREIGVSQEYLRSYPAERLTSPNSAT